MNPKPAGPPRQVALGKTQDFRSDYNKIPAELTALPQWVCAYANKVPINPKTGRNASVTDPTTWGTFVEAVAAGCPHIGFVFTEQDPYTGIDLDDPLTTEQKKRHGKIVREFESYTETSRSGNGVHIIVKGKIPCAVKRDKFEVYDRGRYFIMTGKHIDGYPDTIEERQGLLDRLVEDMGGGTAQILDHRSKTTGRWFRTFGVRSLDRRVSQFPTQPNSYAISLALVGHQLKSDPGHGPGEVLYGQETP